MASDKHAIIRSSSSLLCPFALSLAPSRPPYSHLLPRIHPASLSSKATACQTKDSSGTDAHLKHVFISRHAFFSSSRERASASVVQFSHLFLILFFFLFSYKKIIKNTRGVFCYIDSAPDKGTLGMSSKRASRASRVGTQFDMCSASLCCCVYRAF